MGNGGLLVTSGNLNTGPSTTPYILAGGTLDITGGIFSAAGAVTNNGALLVDGGAVTLGGGITNNAGALLVVGQNKTLNLGGLLTNAGEVQLGGGAASISYGFSNTGLIRGDGVIAGGNNNPGGEIRAENGKRLKFTSSVSQSGNLNLQGGTAEFQQLPFLGTTGQVNGHGTLIVPLGQNTGSGSNGTFGLYDYGALQLSDGNTDIYGSVNLPGVSQMFGGPITGPGTGKVLIGAGGVTASFYGDVLNNGALFRIATGSTAVFFGTVHGASSFSGGGTVDFEGTHQVGNSPAVVGIGGNAIYGVASSLEIDIGGTTPGNLANNYAQLNIASSASLGGTLNLIPYNGFVPVSGDKFTVMTYGNETGAFSSITGTTPAPGLTYSAVYLPTGLVIVTTTNGDKTWGVDSDGNSSIGSNWLGGIAPGGIGDSAAFTTIITAPRTVTLDTDTTVGRLKFDSPNNYLIAGPHTLTLQATGAAAATISDSNVHGNGAHTISAPITLASDLSIVQNSGGTLRLTGPLNDSSADGVTKSGSGTAEISARRRSARTRRSPSTAAGSASPSRAAHPHLAAA